MKNKKSKKLIILYVLKMLEDYPEKNKPISYTIIAKILNDLGVSCDRKTVSRNVNYLIEFGCPIVKQKGGVCYLNNNNYTPLLKDTKFK